MANLASIAPLRFWKPLTCILVLGTVALTWTVACQAGSPTKVEAKVETTAQTKEKAEPLTGSQLWAINCNRCHMYRSSAEFTASQWQPIMLHMRVRANIPAAQAREILKFLQAGAGK